MSRLILPTLAALALAACQPTAFPSRELPGDRLTTHLDADGREVLEPCSDWRQAQLEHPMDALAGNPAPVHRFGFGCSQDVNLARMVVDPDDLLGRGRTARAGATGAGAAVQRYYDGKITPLPESSLKSLDQGN